MMDALDSGLTGFVAVSVLQLLHSKCVESLVAVVDMFTLDRKVVTIYSSLHTL